MIKHCGNNITFYQLILNLSNGILNLNKICFYLSNVVKIDVIKKTEYDTLVTKVNDIDNTNFVSRTKDEKDGSDFEDKIDKIDKKYLILLIWLKKQILIPKLLK